MKDWVLQLFSSSGGVSMVRFLSFICVLTACIIALASIHKSESEINAAAVLCSTFLGFGLGAKVTQKFAEKSTDVVAEARSEK